MNNRINSSDLLMAPELTGGPFANHLVIDQGEVRIGSDLMLGEAVGSQSVVQLIDGVMTVGGNVVAGAGASRIEMRGGLLQIEGDPVARTLIAAGDPASVLVPVDSSLDGQWQSAAFDDGTWPTGPTGIGFERNVGLETLVATDLQSEMYNHNATAYVRVPFEWNGSESVDELTCG